MEDGICYIRVATAKPGDRIGMVRYMEMGYYSTEYDDLSLSDEEVDRLIDQLNLRLQVSREVSAAMFVGSMFGWSAPGAAAAHFHLHSDPGAKPDNVKISIAGVRPSGSDARIAAAMREFEDSAAALANEAMDFFDAHEDDLLHCLAMHPDVVDGVAEIRRLIERRRKAQESFLNSLADG